MVSDLLEKSLYSVECESAVSIFCRAAEWSRRYD